MRKRRKMLSSQKNNNWRTPLDRNNDSRERRQRRKTMPGITPEALTEERWKHKEAIAAR